jgi:hypothetical protein
MKVPGFIRASSAAPMERVVYAGLGNPISEECTLQSTLPEKREAPDCFVSRS